MGKLLITLLTLGSLLSFADTKCSDWYEIYPDANDFARYCGSINGGEISNPYLDYDNLKLALVDKRSHARRACKKLLGLRLNKFSSTSETSEEYTSNLYIYDNTEVRTYGIERKAGPCRIVEDQGIPKKICPKKVKGIRVQKRLSKIICK